MGLDRAACEGMQESLKTRTVRALSWSFVQEAAMRGLQFGITILLARLLAPEQFGLVAMLSVFIGFAQALVDGGFASALIQAKQPDESHKCSVFYFNIIASLVLASALWFAAPLVSEFYHQPLLTPMLRVLALLPVINGFGLIQSSLMVRDLEFKKQTIIVVVSTFASGTVALTLAWFGFGVWSLVFQQLSQSLVRVALLWAFSNWRPQLRFSLRSLGEMFRFGWGMLCSAILASVYENLYPLLIGKFFSAASLGYFNRAQSLQAITSQSLGAIAGRITFPVLSSLQDDILRFRAGIRQAIVAITFVQFPMMIGLAVVSKPLILLVLTEKWAPSIPYLQLLAFAGLLYPLHVLNLHVLAALGRSDLFFRLEVLKVVIFLVVGLATFHWGIMAMIWGQLFSGVAAYFINSYFTKTLIGYSIWDQLRDMYPCLAASVVMGSLVAAVAPLLPSSSLLQLIFRVTFGVFVYFLMCRAFRSEALVQLADFALRRGVRAT